MPSEFNLIQQYFTRAAKQTDLSIGDDAALIQVQTGHQLAISTDMLVADTHFYAHDDPEDIGWKSLAVNLSDMAAMGAQPKWATLAIALPQADASWLGGFTRGFFACADLFNIDLIGGDTTHGPLNISVTIMGEIPAGRALRRDAAKAGDDIWVSGQLGDAAMALAHLQGKLTLQEPTLQANLHALRRPMPRVALGLKLREYAHSCIDISDGLAQDLGHILAASQVGAEIFYAQIPKQMALQANINAALTQYVLAGGDDYELCFTAPQKNRSHIEKLAVDLKLAIARIGNIHAGSGLTIFDQHNERMTLKNTGYNHFSADAA